MAEACVVATPLKDAVEMDNSHLESYHASGKHGRAAYK